jgi:tetratricopeptide (TPR) repeat protein
LNTELSVNLDKGSNDGTEPVGETVKGQSFHWLRSKYAIPVFVISLTFMVYVGTLQFEFVYDDLGQIVENNFIQSWQHVPLYFTEHVWHYQSPTVAGNYYRPIFLLWLLINHTLFGLNPMGWHLTTVLLHLVSTLSVFLIAKKLTKDEAAAGFAALIFGFHPVHIEGVVWVSGVTEPLLGALLLPSFLCFLSSREQKSRSRYITSLGLFALALLSKETAVILPVIIAAYVWIFESTQQNEYKERLKNAVKAAIPFFALTFVYLIARSIALEGFGHPLTKLPFSTILLTWPSILWFYIQLLIWPVGLSAFYDTPYVTSPGFANFYLPAIIVVIVAVALWWASRRSPVIKFATLWLILPMLPLMNLSYFIEGEIAHDRYLYLPSVGFAIILALALRKLNFNKAVLFGQPAVQVAAILVLACTLATITVTQNQYWASDLLLFYRGVKIAPNNNIAANNLANTFFKRGMHEEAIDLYRSVLERDPRFWLTSYNLGYSYYKLGNFDEAERYLRWAIGLNPAKDSDQHMYLGLVQMKTNRLDEAAASMRRAIDLRPFGTGYYFALGTVLKKQGDFTGALTEFKKELARNPQQAAAKQEIAEIEARLSKLPEKSNGQ